MHLNHINLVVKDVDRAVDLFTHNLGFSLIVNRNSKMAVLESSNNFALVIWGQQLNNDAQIPQYPRSFHIGFYQRDERTVNEVYEKLVNDSSLKFESAPKKIRDSFGFYFYFENLMIEISVTPYSESY